MNLSTLRNVRRRLVYRLGGAALWQLEALVTRYSLVETTPLIDPAQFPWTRTLEENYLTIRHELEDVLSFRARIPAFHTISKDQRSITSDDRWRTYFLFGMGYKAERNCARCPETTRLIEQVPGMRTAFFSILEAGKHIPAHRGLYKGFLRYHLGLVVPEPPGACRMRVADHIVHWEEGKSVMFDDTYQHEVWNETNQVRVVLFMDVVRPLKRPYDVFNELVMQAVKRTAYVQDARRNQQRWEEEFETHLSGSATDGHEAGARTVEPR
jgi:ornithine lipid ester-linked acyl 2-hydroxylase